MYKGDISEHMQDCVAKGHPMCLSLLVISYLVVISVTAGLLGFLCTMACIRMVAIVYRGPRKAEDDVESV